MSGFLRENSMDQENHKFIVRWIEMDCPKTVSNVTIVEGIRFIPALYFQFCNDLKIVNLPESLYKIGEYAFYYCKSLERINIPRKVVYIGNAAFENCDKLRFVQLPPTLREIQSRCFQRCESLIEVVNTDALLKIGERAFESCRSLQKINLESVETLDKLAFNDCTKLQTIFLSTNIRFLNETLFYGCESLEYVGPKSYSNVLSKMGLCLPNLELIMKKAFCGCTMLKNVFLTDGLVLEEYCFEVCDGIEEISVPGDLICTDYSKRSYFGECKSMESVKIRPVANKVNFEVVFEMLYHIAKKRPLIAAKPCMNDDVYPFELAIFWLVQNKNPFHFDKPTGNIDQHEFRSACVTKSLYLFLRNNPMVLKKYI